MISRSLRALCLALLTTFLTASTASAQLVAEPEEVSFGSMKSGEQRSLPLTIRNVGPDTVVLGDAWLLYQEGRTDRPFSVDGGSCATTDTLEPDATCEMTATFTAPSKSASFEALVVVEGEDLGVEPAVALLSGQAVLPPPPPPVVLQADPTRIVFPRTRLDAVSEPRQARIRNAGGGPVALPPAVVTNPHFVVVSNGCPAELAPGATCTVGVVFKPTEALPLAIGHLVGEDRHVGMLAFGPLDPATNRYPLAVGLSGEVAPRFVPDSTKVANQRLVSVADSIPGALRGGPRSARLAAFQAPVAGTLALRVYARQGKGRVLVAKGRKRLAKDESHRLRVSLTRRGRELLSRPKRTRVRVELAFTERDGDLAERASRVVVKAPKRTKSR